jgi:FlaG/FlaF family flagellin (archaellin)
MNIASFILVRNRAQSEATGTILMVAATIVVGATVAVFAFGVFDGGETAPQSNFDFEFQPDTTEVRVSLTQGDSIEGDQLRFSGAAVEKTSFGGITEWSGSELSAGASATVAVTPGETLRIVWQSDEGESTAILATYDVPGETPTASIENVFASGDDKPSGRNGEVEATITFDNAESVFVRVEDTPSFGRTSAAQTLTKSGERLTFSLSAPYVQEGEEVTITVYRGSSDDGPVLAQRTVLADDD